MKDYYLVLGIGKNASPEQIKQAYRDKCKQYHPDRHPEHQAPNHFLNIREAYDILSDTERRRLYDRTIEKKTARISGLTNITEVFSSPSRTKWESFRDFFSAFGFSEQFNPVMPNPEPEFELILSFQEAASGGKYVFEIPFNEQCPVCRGLFSGKRFYCTYCGNNGSISHINKVHVHVPENVRHGTRLTARSSMGEATVYISLKGHRPCN